MKFALRWCVVPLLATTLVAQMAPKPKTKKSAAKPAEPAITAADVQALRDALAAQQRQIDQLKQELQQRDQAFQQAQAAAAEATNKADAANSQVTQQQQAVTQLRGDVADLKTNVTNTALSLQEEQKRVGEFESPAALHFKGITLTPGGFLAAETVWRKRALASDINTPFNSIPMPGASQSSMSEFFASGRQSRVSLLGEGKLKSAKLSAYYEADFLSAGVTSNNNQSNSYTFRQRQAWGQAALQNGFTFTGGQMWSLVMEIRKGLDPRNEAFPMQIDAQYIVGMSWAREYGFRITKNFANKAWLGFSVENPQTTLTASGNLGNVLVGAGGTLGGLYNNQANYSFNAAPDLIFKAAFEPGIGHYEVFGVVSQFRDRIFPCAGASASSPCVVDGTTAPSAAGASNDTRTGGGVGANARFLVANKHLELAVHAFGGEGVGRYGNSGLPDVTVRPDGTLALIRSYQGLGTIEYHHPKWDVYLYGGGEYAGRTAYVNSSGAGVGYGSPLFNNSGCSKETLPGTNGFTPGALGSCRGDTRNLWEATFGFWYKIYNGPKGRLQLGPQYAYAVRNTWSGTGGQPKGIENMFFTSFRYYLP